MTFDEFKVEVELKENVLSCEIVFKDQPKCDLKYAFYLLFNGQKQKVRWYSESNTASFQLVEDGEYKVMGFVMQNTDKYINTSQSVQFIFDECCLVDTSLKEDLQVPISIFGSCVSRDLLEYDESKRLLLKTYIARQSIVSAVSAPVSIEKEAIDLTSHFQKECVYNDFKKNTMEVLKQDESKYLLIDLIDERFKLAVCKGSNGQKSYVTYSAYLQESEYIKFPKLIEKKKKKWFREQYFIQHKSLDKYMKEFCKQILGIYAQENIIIHRCKLLPFYLDKNNQIKQFDKNYLLYNQITNELLSYMYNYLEAYMPKAKVIDICDKYYADENHKWGLSPMHYEKEYYKEIFSIILKYTTSLLGGKNE